MRVAYQIAIILLSSAVAGISAKIARQSQNFKNEASLIRPVLETTHDRSILIISRIQALHLLEPGKSQFIDVRSKVEFERAHIPGSINIPLEDEKSLIIPIQLLYKLRRTVIYCDQDQCKSSISLATKLRSMGFSQVTILEGGWKEWKSHKQPISYSPQR